MGIWTLYSTWQNSERTGLSSRVYTCKRARIRTEWIVELINSIIKGGARLEIGVDAEMHSVAAVKSIAFVDLTSVFLLKDKLVKKGRTTVRNSMWTLSDYYQLGTKELNKES